MDPDEARHKLCTLSTDIGHEEDPERCAAMAEEMAMVWDGLDGWLRSGGHRPRVWQRAPGQ